MTWKLSIAENVLRPVMCQENIEDKDENSSGSNHQKGASITTKIRCQKMRSSTPGSNESESCCKILMVVKTDRENWDSEHGRVKGV